MEGIHQTGNKKQDRKLIAKVPHQSSLFKFSPSNQLCNKERLIITGKCSNQKQREGMRGNKGER